MAEDVRGILLAGVGGQGVIMASMVVAEACLQAGYDVKQSEVHGMAQRGGSVFSHLRFGPEVSSPLVPLGSATVLAAFEWAEGLRWLPYVSPEGAVVADVRRIVPPGACRDHRTWVETYPARYEQVLRERAAAVRLLDASAMARELGNVRAANSVVLGAVANFLDLPEVCWEKAIARRVPPHTVDVNLEAFHLGREAPSLTLPEPEPLPPVPTGSPRIHLDRSWCKDCGICPRVCPEYCLAMDEHGRLAIVAPEACTGCRLCELLCPDFAITIDRDPVPVPAGKGER